MLVKLVLVRGLRSLIRLCRRSRDGRRFCLRLNLSRLGYWIRFREGKLDGLGLRLQ